MKRKLMTNNKKEKVIVLNTKSVGVITGKGERLVHYFLEGSLVVFKSSGFALQDSYVEGEGAKPTSFFQYIESESVEWFSEL